MYVKIWSLSRYKGKGKFVFACWYKQKSYSAAGSETTKAQGTYIVRGVFILFQIPEQFIISLTVCLTSCSNITAYLTFRSTLCTWERNILNYCIWVLWSIHSNGLYVCICLNKHKWNFMALKDSAKKTLNMTEALHIGKQ